jgi:hypothetical protein
MLELTSAEVADLVRTTLLPILFVVVVAVIATRLASPFVHGAWAADGADAASGSQPAPRG